MFENLYQLARQGVRLKQAACGREHTLFLDQSDRIWACGNPENGRLGITPRPGMPGYGKGTISQMSPYRDFCIADLLGH